MSLERSSNREYAPTLSTKEKLRDLERETVLDKTLQKIIQHPSIRRIPEFSSGKVDVNAIRFLTLDMIGSLNEKLKGGMQKKDIDNIQEMSIKNFGEQVLELLGNGEITLKDAEKKAKNFGEALAYDLEQRR
ncbi:hypothetical protein KA057_01420 [Candidatus Gracilibacteria bacterium]|nr:hypothetical protein [Candidatus Gracilibacteria bacterium]